MRLFGWFRKKKVQQDYPTIRPYQYYTPRGKTYDEDGAPISVRFSDFTTVSSLPIFPQNDPPYQGGGGSFGGGGASGSWSSSDPSPASEADSCSSSSVSDGSPCSIE